MSGVEFRVLGPLEVAGPGGPVEIGAPKHRALLSLLLLEPGRVVSVDRLIDQLWNGLPPASATTTLQAYVSNVRRALEPDRAAGAPATLLVTRPPGYALDVEPDQVDARRFERLVVEARTLAADDPATAAAQLADALTLWRGQPFADVAYEPWAHSEVARLEELRIAVLEEQLDLELRLGRHVSVAIEAERMVKEHPVRERLREQLMLALYRSGRQADALRAFREARDVLVEELGIEPGPSLRALEDKILSQDPSLDWQPPAAPIRAAPVAPAPAAPARPAPGEAEAAHADGEAPADTFVGRTRECEALTQLVDAVRAGRGRVGLVSGEPGIGKTRLCEAIAHRAAERGLLVVWGRGYEGDGAPAFWPWVLVLRSLAEEHAAEVAAALTDVAAADIARVVPEYAQWAGDAGASLAGDAETARFRFFDAVAGLLRRLANVRPVAVVLDDLHWADVSSLRLVEFTASTLGDAPVLLLGTYRDTEARPDSPLSATLSVLAREPSLARVALRGLSPDEVGKYVAAVVGHDADPALVGSLHDRTAGNPFFVAELVRLLRTEGHLGDGSALASPGAAATGAAAPFGRAMPVPSVVPQGVRDVIRSRLGQLPEGSVTVLTAAAIAGRQFDLALVARVCDLDEDDVLDLVEAAWMIGIVDEVSTKPGHFEFSHELVRETLSEGLGTLRRVRLHRAVAESLEALHGERNPAYLAECAYHFSAAAPGGDALKAVLYGQKAADQLVARLAYEDAIPVYERAIELVNTYDVGSAATRNDLLIGLAWALRSSGRLAEARVVLDRAIDVARASGDAVRFARAVLGHGGGGFWGWWVDFGVTDHALIAHLEEALVRLGPEDSWLRCELLGRLAVELYFEGDLERRDALSGEAVEMARRIGHPAAIAAALAARHVAMWRPENLTERLAIATELVEIALGNQLLERELIGRHLLMVDRFEAGEIDAANAEYAHIEALADEIGQHSFSVQLAWFCAMREFLAGNFAESERLAQAAFEENVRSNESAAWMAFGAQTFHLRRETGRLAELEPLVRAALTTQPQVRAAWQLALAEILLEQGLVDDAAKLVDDVAEPDLPMMRYGLMRPVELRQLAELCARLGHRHGAEIVERHLAVFEAEMIVLGTGHLCTGSVAFTHGIVVQTLGRQDEAIELLTHALEVEDRVGAKPHATRTRLWLAEALLARGADGDTERARQLLARAATDATSMGHALAPRINELLASSV